MQVEVINENPFIIVGERLQGSLKTYINELNPESVVIVCDDNTFKYCHSAYKIVFDSFERSQTLIINSGDTSKNLENAVFIWEKLAANNASRKSLLIALGGGMICDLAAFAASVFMRGIPFVLMPTSILAMVDAAIGGKTGLNFNSIKNLLGTFRNPEAVFADLHFLSTLPFDEANSGKAEVLKHALLQGESKFEEFKSDFDKPLSVSATSASMRFKLSITQADFEEKGIREILNLGHTSAHAIESLYLFRNKTLLHGNAVAAGLWIESLISELFFDFPAEFNFVELRNFIGLKFSRLDFSESDIPFLLNAMSSDKKNKIGLRSFVLLNQDYSPKIGCHPSEELITTACLRYLQDA
jgi:3-dehydroquinate synthase